MHRSSSAEGAPGAGRFHVLGVLGEGGNGVVYRALDLALGTEVALKVLTRTSGRDRFRFKREFRGLSEVVHPNLVRLYELFAESDQWYLTMELIDGVSLDVYLDGGPRGDAGSPFETTETTVTLLPAQRLDRLRSCFVQLADAVLAIHASGKIHRDLKPSNVLVQPDGRVVVLDYGLIADTSGLSIDHTHEAVAVGTPAYMSPEQATDQPLGPASDWYSVGAMLYRALTGVRPFEGPPSEILHRRVVADPAPPRSIVADLAPELDALCMALLDRDPGKRADGRILLAAFGASPSPATQAIEQATAAPPFVGRAAELAALADALDQAREGRSVVTTVTGPSGIGKSTLLRHFLDHLDPVDTVVFQGRCYERETMPYQAIDSLIDGVANRLLAEPAERVAALLPRDAMALARLFPTLERVRALAAPRALSQVPPDQAELRRRAIAALGELLSNLSGTRTPVFFLDDLQWSDPDSGNIVTELVHHFEDSGALFVVATRTGGEAGLRDVLAVERDRRRAGTSTVRLSPAAPEPRSSLVVRELPLAPMPTADARALFAAMAGDGAAETLADQAAGMPLLIAELARRRGAGEGARRLEDLFGERIATLHTDTRRLLELAVIATRPLRLDLAAGLLDGDAAAALAVLRIERLVRVDRKGKHQTLEPMHDQIRSAVIDAMPGDDLTRLHAQLAAALEAHPDALDTDLVAHWLAAGQPARAAPHARRAAVAAEASVAFHRAAELYRLALMASGLGDAERRELLVRIAACLANVGRLDAALAALGEASSTLDEHAAPSERRELRRLEIEYALRVGDYGRGLADCRALLREIGYSIPTSTAGTVASIVWHALRTRARGLGFTAVPAEQLRDTDRERIDILWSMTTGMVYVNPGIGRLVQVFHVRAALDGGDPDRVARALAIEIPNLAQQGPRARPAIARATARCRELLAGRHRADLDGLCTASCAVASAIIGDWKDAVDHARGAEQLLRDHASGMRWTLAMAQFYRVMGAWYLGDTAEVIRLVTRYVAEAEDLGDAHVLGGMRTGRGSVYWLIVDQPEDGRVMAAAGLPRRNPDDAFHLHDYFHACADAHLDLYEGTPARAVDRVEAIWSAFRGSLLTRVQFVLLDGALLRARCALARAAAGDEPKRWLKIARAMCDQVDGERAPWATPLVQLIRAGIARVEGDAMRAIALCEAAAAGAAGQGMLLYSRAARHRLAECKGTTADVVLDELRAGGVVDPVRLLRVLAPGW